VFVFLQNIVAHQSFLKMKYIEMSDVMELSTLIHSVLLAMAWRWMLVLLGST
jgi:hypothetical protein